MDQPSRCYSCGLPMLPSYYATYRDALEAGHNSMDALAMVTQINRLCCKRMILSYRPLMDEQFYKSNSLFQQKRIKNKECH